MTENSSLDVVQFSGELDIDRREAVAAALSAAMPPRPALIDLSDVTYADSTIISELLRFRSRAERGGQRIAILVGASRVARVLEYAGLKDAFAIFEDRGAALTYLHDTTA
jgi:anti-anti-sigma factor